MKSNIIFTLEARRCLDDLARDNSLSKRFRSVRKAIGYLESNPKHHGLHTHKHRVLKGKNGEEVFIAYVENHAPQAYRILWHYGPGKKTITIFSIAPHP